MNLDTLSPEHESRFKKWRWSVYATMFVGWSCHILVRKTLPSTMSSLIQHQGFSRDDIGMIASCFATSYGWSKFMGAIISDHASTRKVFSCGLILSGLCGILFPLASNISLACGLWFILGIVQGLGWPPCVVLLNSWYPPSQIGRWWSILSSSGNITAALLPLLVIFITSTLHWDVCYYLFGMLTFSIGLLAMFTIRDSPTDIGMGSIHKEAPSKHNTGERIIDDEKNAGSNCIDKSKFEKGYSTPNKPETKLDEYTSAGGKDQETTKHHNAHKNKNAPTRSCSWYSVFFLPNLWVVNAVYSILYLVNSCATNWTQLYFVQEVNMTETSAATCYSMFQVGAIAGNLVSGYISDLLVTPRTLKTPCPRAPFLLAVAMLLVGTIHLLRTTVVEGATEMWVSTVMFVLGFLAYSGVAVVGLCAMDVVDKSMVGTAHGLACAVAQAGSFIAGWPFSHILETHSWNTAYFIVEVALIVMVILCIYLVFLLIRHLKKQKQD